MKTKIVMLFMALMMTNIGLFAQDRKRATPEERAKTQTEQLAKKLNLSEDQKAKILEVNLKHAKDMPQANKDSKEKREKRREEIQKKQQQKDADIKALLTDEQKTQYDAHQKERQEKMKNRSGRNR